MTGSEGKQILIVEDEGLIAAELQKRLQRLGYSAPATAPSGEEALALLRTRSFDLVLMDICLRGSFDGISAAQRLKSEFDIPVVFLTGCTEPATVQRARLAEPYGFISKPASDGALGCTVQLALHNHEIQRQVRASAAWLATVLKTIRDGVIATNTDGEIVFMNPAAEVLTGWNSTEASGRPVMDVVNLFDIATSLPLRRPAGSTPGPQCLCHAKDKICRLRGRHGTSSIVQLECFECQRGTCNGVVMVIRDVTEQQQELAAREQTEAELRDTNQVLTALIRCAPLPVTVLDKSGVVRVWNPAAEKTLGWTEFEALGKPLAELLPSNEEGLVAPLLQSLETGGLHGMELHQQRKDGAELDLKVFSAPLTNGENSVDGLISLLMDVTEMNRMTEAFRDSRERFRSAFLNAPNGIAITTLDGRFLRVNRAFCDMCGYTETQLLRLSWTALIHPDDQWAISLANRDSAFTQEIRLEGPSGESQGPGTRRPNGGGHRHVLWSTSVVRDTEGTPLYAISQCIDISERKRAEVRARQYAADLERSNQDLQHFAAIASHDLQEPLRMIRGFLDVLAKRYLGKLDQHADECISYATDGAVRLQNLIRGLLEYSRVSAGNQSLLSVDLEKVLSQAVLNLQTAIKESAAVIKNGTLPVVLGDETQLIQLFQNLIGNAVKFRATRPPVIQIRALENGDMWEVAVADNGIGFNSEQTNRMFQMFQRLHTRSQYPGTGIGLALCKRIVERHGGRIWADSTPGSGAAFYFTIPRIKESLR